MKLSSFYVQSITLIFTLVFSLFCVIKAQNLLEEEQKEIENDSEKLLHLILRRESGDDQSGFDEFKGENAKEEAVSLPPKASPINSLNSNNNIRIPFIISKVDLLDRKNSELKIPLIQPAAAQISPASSDNSDVSQMSQARKRKKNFSKLAKSLLIATRMFDKKSLHNGKLNDTIKSARSFTSSTSTNTHFKIFEVGGFCSSKSDGLYDDPDDCQNFIICFADRTFRTRCSFGTKWNHIIRECDFADKVDCQRISNKKVNTTLAPTTTVPLKQTTVMIQPKFSNITLPNGSNNNLRDELRLASIIKTNMLLVSIIIPLGLLSVVIILVSIFYWHNKFKERRQQELARTVSKVSNSLCTSRNSIDDSKNHQQMLHKNSANTKFSFKKLSTCCCYGKLASLSGCHKHFRTSNLLKSCSSARRGDHVRTQIINTSALNILHNNSNLNKDCSTSSIAYLKTEAIPDVMCQHGSTTENSKETSSSSLDAANTFNQSANTKNITNESGNNNSDLPLPPPPTLPMMLTINDFSKQCTEQKKAHNDCYINTNTESRVTLASHFEDNNWDYNFATRGLYMSQPWVRGRYTHTLGSESIATSTVLTLDPVTADMSSEKNCAKAVELYTNEETCGSGSDTTDGYYA